MMAAEHPPVVHTFDEAITMAGNGRFQMVVLFVCGIALMASISEGVNMAFVLPIAKCDLAISVSQQGLINSVGFIGVILTSHMWGFLADTWGRQKVLRTALGLTFAACMVSSMSYTSTMLLISRLALGLSISGVQAAGISYIGEFHNDRNRQRYVTLAVAGMTVSAIYQSLLGLAILPQTWSYAFLGLQYTPWRLFLLMNGSIIGIAWVVMMFLPESPKYLLAMDRHEEAVRVLRQVHRWNRCKTKFTVGQVTLQEGSNVEQRGSGLRDARTPLAMLRLMWEQTWPLFRAPYAGRILMLFYVTFAIYVVSHGLYLWLPQILDLYYLNMDEPVTICEAIELASTNIETGNTRDAMSATIDCIISPRKPITYTITTAFGICFLAMYVIAGMLMSRLGNRNTMVFWLAVTAAATAALFWSNNFIGNMVLFMLMSSSAPAGGLLAAASAEFFPTHYKAMALCLILMVCRIGSITGSNLVGALLFVNCTALIGIDVALMITATVVYFLIFSLPTMSSK